MTSGEESVSRRSSEAEPWSPPRVDARTAWRLARGKDVDRALSAAERMIKAAEESIRHQQNVRIALYSFVILGLVSVAAVFVSFIDSRTLPFTYTLPLAAVGVMIAIVSSGRLLVSVKSFRSSVDFWLQVQLANEIAGQVESVYLEVAYREHWSNLRLTTTKARLAAFDLNQRGRPSRRSRPRDDQEQED